MYTEQVAAATSQASIHISENRLLSREEVERQTSLSRSTIYQQMSTGKFPSNIKIGVRRVAWWSYDIDSWVAAHISTHKTHRKS